MRKSNYKKPKSISQSLLSTIKILLTVGLVAVTAMVSYFIATKGWNAVVSWFQGKYFCMVAILGLFVVVAILWILSLAKKIKGLSENE